MTNLKYDLPSAVEWEMASNNKSVTFHYSGSDNIDDVGWSRKSMPVGLKSPNSYGIFDMSGNVAKICKYGDGFAIKGGKPWGNYRVSTKYTFKHILKDMSSPYVGFRVIMRVPTGVDISETDVSLDSISPRTSPRIHSWVVDILSPAVPAGALVVRVIQMPVG